jgi:hypothetical protein
LSIADFLDLLKANQPVIFSDAMDPWSGFKEWTPDFFRNRFGSQYVQIYGDGFDLKDVRQLAYYLDHFFKSEPNRTGEPTPYVRWYTRLKDVNFVWADPIFKALGDQWTTPYFMPEDGYLLPFVKPGDSANPAKDLFPAKGLFISGKGAKTRLHCDPWQTDAVLFQVYGEKEWVMYPPEQGPLLCDAQGQCVDPQNPDPSRFPRFAEATPAFQFQLKPGEGILVPRGWYHQVITTTNAISLTWNFAHQKTQSTFLAYLDAQLAKGDDLEVLQFFYSKWLPKDASCQQMAQFLREQLSKTA